jgi:hypothetical protein
MVFGLSKEERERNAALRKAEKAAYEAEKMRQAPLIGKARAKAEANVVIKEAKKGKKGGGLMGALGSFQDFGANYSANFDAMMGAPPRKGKKRVRDPFDFG